MSEDRREDRLTDDEGEGFLSRWSQRKAMARDGVELPDEPELPEQPPVVDAAGVDDGVALGTTAGGGSLK